MKASENSADSLCRCSCSLSAPSTEAHCHYVANLALTKPIRPLEHLLIFAAVSHHHQEVYRLSPGLGHHVIVHLLRGSLLRPVERLDNNGSFQRNSVDTLRLTGVVDVARAFGRLTSRAFDVLGILVVELNAAVSLFEFGTRRPL